ncbi:MAG: alkaline phosphatase [Burkholderiales bacterium]
MNRKLIMLAVVLILVLAAAFLLLRGPLDAGQEHTAAPSAAAEVTPVATTSPDISISILPSKPPKYIFIMIGDGMGKGQRALAQGYTEYKGSTTPLVMNTFPVSGTVTTRSLNADITDSAAAGTALATGHKTNNGMLSITPEGEALKTIIEEAEDLGLSTGVVTTTSITNATPAAFASHAESRAYEADIALDYLDSGVDFFAGGGDNYFLPYSYSGGLDAAGTSLESGRGDERDLVSEFADAGYKTFIGARGALDFASYIPSAGDKVLAAFANAHMPYELDRTSGSLPAPSLESMTQKAVEALAFDSDGFVLTVEGGRIDHACHINDAASAVRETLAFDEAVAAAYDFYTRHPEETLIVVVADHETGGLRFELSDVEFAHIDAVKVSIQDRVQTAYAGDREAFYSFIAEGLGLADLNPRERGIIDEALDAADEADPSEGYGSMVALAVSDIVSRRVGVKWSDTAHTAASVPLTAVGLNADRFSGKKDNAEIGQLLFDVLREG